MPMIPLGLKETKEINFMEPFADFILEHYSEEPTIYTDAIADITDTRQVYFIIYIFFEHLYNHFCSRPPKHHHEIHKVLHYSFVTTIFCIMSKGDSFHQIEIWVFTLSGMIR